MMESGLKTAQPPISQRLQSSALQIARAGDKNKWGDQASWCFRWDISMKWFICDASEGVQKQDDPVWHFFE